MFLLHWNNVKMSIYFNASSFLFYVWYSLYVYKMLKKVGLCVNKRWIRCSSYHNAFSLSLFLRWIYSHYNMQPLTITEIRYTLNILNSTINKYDFYSEFNIFLLLITPVNLPKSWKSVANKWLMRGNIYISHTKCSKKLHIHTTYESFNWC